MKLKTKILIIISVYILFFSVFTGLIFQTQNEIEEAQSKSHSALEIVRDVFELNIITTDFILSQTNRSLQQWQSKYVTLGNIIETHRSNHEKTTGHTYSAEGLKLLNSLYDNHQDVGKIFLQIKDGNTSSASIELLSKQLEMKSQLMVSDAFKIADLAEVENQDAQQTFILLNLLLLFSIFFVIILFYYLIDKTVIKPVNSLKDGAKRVGEGNLDYRIDISTQDELGDLAKSFNLMTGNIQVSQNELIESEEFLQSMMNSVSSIFYMFDVYGNFQLWNTAFERVSGYSKEEIKKMKPTDFFTKEEVGNVEKAIKESVEKGSSSVEADFLSKDGTKTPMLLSGNLSKDKKNQPVIVGTGKDITELRKIQEEIMVFKKFIENSSQGFGMATMDSNIVYLNRGLKEFLAIDNMNDALKKSFADFYPEEMQQRIQNQVMPALKNKGEWIGELGLKRSDGSVIPTMESFFLIKDDDEKPMYICDVITNISDIKKAEKKIRENEEKFKAISDYTIDLEWWIDTKGKLIWTNKSSEKFTGYEPQDAYKLACKDFFIKAHQAQFSDLLETGLTEKTTINDFEFKLEKKNGDQIDVAISWQPIYNFDGKWTGIRASIRDISDRKKAEEEVRRLNEELEDKVKERTKELQQTLYDLQIESEKRKQAESQRIQSEKMATVGTLSAGVAHELNNPLMGIMNYIEYAEKHVQNKKVAHLLKDAEKEVTRCTDIVQNLLTFSRTPKEGKEPFSEINLESIVDRVLKLLSYQLKDIEVTKSIEDDIPDVKIMANKMQQVVLNIVDNAVDVLEEADVSDKHIAIDISKNKSEINLSILNNGPVISKKVMDKIFDPFFTTKEVGKGTGLGLSICNNIIKEHHGSLKVERIKGKGTAFVIRLPIKNQKRKNNGGKNAKI